MITSQDPEYQLTLEVKRGNKEIPILFQSLIMWINQEYLVKAMNVYFDTIIPDARPRIQIIFENQSDVAKFREKGIGNYISEKQNAISKKFIEIVQDLNLQATYPVKNLFVCYSEFSSIYNSNIYKSVPEIKLKELFEYESDLIWRIHIIGAGLVVFFQTNKEKNSTKNDLMMENLKNEYYSILKPYDEFGYLKETYVKRESKEDFDKNYDSNWFYWSRNN